MAKCAVLFDDSFIDFHSNGLYDVFLGDSRPGLNGLRELGLNSRVRGGIHVPCCRQLCYLGRQPGDSGQQFLQLSESGNLGLGLSGFRATLRELRPEDAGIIPIIPERRISGNALTESGEGVLLIPKDLLGPSEASATTRRLRRRLYLGRLRPLDFRVEVAACR